MTWLDLRTMDDLQQLEERSMDRPVLLFKHSTRCSISSAAKARLDRGWTDADDHMHEAYLLDLLKHRALSNAVADRYGIEHASPQVLIIHEGRCIHDDSHFGITYRGIKNELDRP